MDNILTSLFPTKCYFCGKSNVPFCESCFDKCKRIDTSLCIVCERPVIQGETHVECTAPHIPESIFCCYVYEGVVRDCIKKAKYSSKLFYPLKKLSFSGVKLFSTSGLVHKKCLVIPIPLSTKKAKSRGFNQAQQIAEVLKKELKLTLAVKALRRVKNTESQYKENREARFENMKNAFVADPELVFNKEILLVDDICTSGATFFDATRALKAAGAKEVHCFALARKFLVHRKAL